MWISEPTLGVGGAPCTLPAGFRKLLPPGPEVWCWGERRRPGPRMAGGGVEPARTGPQAGVLAAVADPCVPATKQLTDFLGGKEGGLREGRHGGGPGYRMRVRTSIVQPSSSFYKLRTHVVLPRPPLTLGVHNLLPHTSKVPSFLRCLPSQCPGLFSRQRSEAASPKPHLPTLPVQWPHGRP